MLKVSARLSVCAAQAFGIKIKIFTFCQVASDKKMSA